MDPNTQNPTGVPTIDPMAGQTPAPVVTPPAEPVVPAEPVMTPEPTVEQPVAPPVTPMEGVPADTTGGTTPPPAPVV
jgi:hypothetical protein